MEQIFNKKSQYGNGKNVNKRRRMKNSLGIIKLVINLSYNICVFIPDIILANIQIITVIIKANIASFLFYWII